MKYKSLLALSIGLLLCSLCCNCYSNKQATRYKEAACVLSTICQTALQKEHLDAISFEELYYDTVDNMDCHGLSIDRDFIEDLHWAY
jgi:hypothetical protein